MTRKHRIATIVLLAAPCLAGASPHAAPPPDAKVSKELLELRARLYKTEPAQARTEVGRFRALCDDEGYPLVGNIANKTNRYSPSQLCADVRSALAAKK